MPDGETRVWELLNELEGMLRRPFRSYLWGPDPPPAMPDGLREELQTLLRLAESRTTSELPGFPTWRQHSLTTLRRALWSPQSVTEADIDAILRSCAETATYRRERGLGDPFAEDRELSVATWTRFRQYRLSLDRPAAGADPRSAPSDGASRRAGRAG